MTHVRKTALEISAAVRAFSCGRFPASFRSRAGASRIAGLRGFENVEKSSANCRKVVSSARNNPDRDRAINRHQNVRVANTLADQILNSEPLFFRSLTY